MTAKKKTMRAAVFLGDGTMELREVPVPQAGPGQVLLRVQACGVCGTDHHIYEGELTEDVHPPVILGHEIAARVEAVGDGVDGFDLGQPAAVDPLIGCGCCPSCRSARPNLCAHPNLIGYKLNGGFAQYVVAPAGKVVPLAESVGPSGGVLCETLACVLNGYRRLGLSPGSSVMILGAGTVGLLWLQLMVNSPCRTVIQTEPVAYRREKARRLGADVVIDPDGEDLSRRVRDELPDGADFIIDATGEPRAIQDAIGTLAGGGTFLIFGVCPESSEVRFDPFQLYNKEARIVASKMPPATLDTAARVIESGRIACDEIVTSRVGIEKAAEAVAAFNDHRDRQVKVAVDPWA